MTFDDELSSASLLEICDEGDVTAFVIAGEDTFNLEDL